MITLDLKLLNRFLLAIVRDDEKVTVEDKEILSVTAILDSKEDYWHIEGNILWHKRTWKQCQERLIAQKLESEVYNHKVFERKRFLKLLKDNILLQVPLDDIVATELALKILRTHNIKSAAAFGVDLLACPILGKPHIVYDEINGNYTI